MALADWSSYAWILHNLFRQYHHVLAAALVGRAPGLKHQVRGGPRNSNSSRQ